MGLRVGIGVKVGVGEGVAVGVGVGQGVGLAANGVGVGVATATGNGVGEGMKSCQSYRGLASSVRGGVLMATGVMIIGRSAGSGVAWKQATPAAIRIGVKTTRKITLLNLSPMPANPRL